MSYGQPPPKTPYGDQDFIKEDWTPQQPGLTPPPPAAAAAYSNRYPGGGFAAQNMPYNSSLVPPQPSSTTLQQGPYGGQQLQQANQTNVANIVQSLTPEDQIFMNSWRRDSFYYRVLPLTAIGSGALFYFNHARNLPQKPVRYLLVSFGAYVIGKWSYKGELKRRLETSPLNTPFMKALRELMGIKSQISELGAEFQSDIGQEYAGFGSSNAPLQPMNSRFGPPMSGGPQAQPFGHDQPGYLSNESDMSLPPPSDETTKSMTSYEELRARNRGLIQK